jgi:hypothetical protein
MIANRLASRACARARVIAHLGKIGPSRAIACSAKSAETLPQNEQFRSSSLVDLSNYRRTLARVRATGTSKDSIRLRAERVPT